MTAVIQAIRKKYEKLLGLGDFDQTGIFRPKLGADPVLAYRLISEIVCKLDEAEEEWADLHEKIEDLSPVEIVRHVPSNLRDFYQSELLATRTQLIVSDIANRVRFVREKYLFLINIQPIDATFAGSNPGGAEECLEIGALLTWLHFELEEIAFLSKEYPTEAGCAFEVTDADRHVRDFLLEKREQFLSAVPTTYSGIPDGAAAENAGMSGDVLRELEQWLAPTKKHESPFQSCRPLFFDPRKNWRRAAAQDAAGFLSEVVGYWEDRAEDHSFSDDWEGRGKRALPLLEKVCDPATVEVAQMELFRPRDWLANLNKLKPIMLDEGDLNTLCRRMLLQVWTSFVFGQWAAVLALSRAILEYAINDCLRDTLTGSDRERRAKARNGLGDLIKALIHHRPVLERIRADMDFIKEHGDKTLHRLLLSSDPSNIFAAEDRFRKTAIEVIMRLKGVLEAMYQRRPDG
jgi:hypothetical protein